MNYNYTDKILFDYLTENPDASVIQINRVTGVSFPLITDFLENKWRGGKGPAGEQGAQGQTGAQGPQGPTGPQGPIGVAWQGPWDNLRTYFANDVVSYGGSSWICLSETTDTPSIDSQDWELLAAVGDVGPAGPTGSTGPAGAAGAQGELGPAGPAGPAGPTGAQGNTGAPGEKGETGEIGPQGIQGATGETGAQGPQGDQGLQGATGATGAAGAGFSNGDAKGDIKYWDGTGWKNLTAGSPGQVLTVAENGEDLTWTNK